jgi:arabinan endo-1,5-alpha-L-arabinosidase
MDFLDAVPNGSFVTARLILDEPYTTFAKNWAADTALYGKNNSLYHRLKNAGFKAIDSFYYARTWAFVFKKGEYYYLFASWDYCCRGEKSTYKLMVGRSKSVTGPYVDKNGVELNKGGGSLVIGGNKNWYGVGHNSVFTFDGKDYTFMHGYDASDKGLPKLIVKEITWIDSWPTVQPMD